MLDDNKVLTLINGDRIGMPNMVSLLFEVNDLTVASPATVSRAGMVYFDVTDMGCDPLFDTWSDKLYAEEGESAKLASTKILAKKWFPALLAVRRQVSHFAVKSAYKLKIFIRL